MSLISHKCKKVKLPSSEFASAWTKLVLNPNIKHFSSFICASCGFKSRTAQWYHLMFLWTPSSSAIKCLQLKQKHAHPINQSILLSIQTALSQTILLPLTSMGCIVDKNKVDLLYSLSLHLEHLLECSDFQCSVTCTVDVLQ